MTDSKKGITLPYKVRSKKKYVFAYFLYFQVPSSSGYLVFTTENTAILVETKKGHNLVSISRNSLKS